MINLTKLEYKRKELIADFSEEELINYIQQLTGKYYLSYFNNDVDVHKNTVTYLKEAISIFKAKYPDLNNYVNFCLLEAVNTILNENIDSGIKLEVIDKPEAFSSKNPFDSLINAFHESRKLYFNDKETIERIEKLEKENKQLKELLNNG